MSKWTGTMAWANSAPIGTEQTAAVPVGLTSNAANAIHVYNPGAVAITVKVRAKWKDSGGTTRTSALDGATIAVPAGTAVTKMVSALGVLDEIELAATNDAAVGAAGAFTAQLAIEFV